MGIIRGTLTGPILYANYPYYARAAHKVDRAGAVQVLTQAHDIDSLNQVAQQLEAEFNRVGFRVTEVWTIVSLRDNVQLLLNILIGFLLAVVGGLGLMGSMSINVLERIREIGVMRIIGASDEAIFRIVIVEGMVIGILSWFVGLLLAILASFVPARNATHLTVREVLAYE